MAAPGGALVRARQLQLAAQVWSTRRVTRPLAGGQMASPLSEARTTLEYLSSRKLSACVDSSS